MNFDDPRVSEGAADIPGFDDQPEEEEDPDRERDDTY